MKLTLLAALYHVRQAELTDGLVELLIELVHRISVRAERKVGNELSSEFRRVHGKQGILFKLAAAAVDHPDEFVRAALYPVVGRGDAAGPGGRGPGERAGVQHPGASAAAVVLVPPLPARPAPAAEGTAVPVQ